MDNPLKHAYDAMAERAQETSPFAGLSDCEFVMAVVSVIQSVPTARVRAFIAARERSPGAKDRYEARQLALVLFAQGELAKLPESVPVPVGLSILLDTLKDAFASRPQD